MKPNPMKIAQVIKRILPYVIAIIFILLFLHQCKETKSLQKLYLNEKNEVSYYKNKLGGMTATVNSMELSEKQLKETILRKNDSLKKLASEFKKIKSMTTGSLSVIIDTIYIPYEVEIPCEFSRVTKYEDKWLSFNLEQNQLGTKISDTEVFTEFTLINGTKRKWILGKQYLTSDLTFTNPNIIVSEMQTIIVPVNVEWYNNKWLYMGVGMLGGFMIAK